MASKRSKILLLSGALALVVVVGLLLFLPVFGRTSFVDPLLRQVLPLKNLGQALYDCAGANEGKFPARIEDLVPEFMDSEVPSLKFRDLRTTAPLDWLYYAGFTTSNRRDTIVVASPKTVSRADGTLMVGSGEFRLVLAVNGRTFLLAESDFQKCLTEQQQPEWLQPTPAPEPWKFLTTLPPYIEKQIADKTEALKSPSREKIRHLIETLRHGEKMERGDAAEALSETAPGNSQVTAALFGALNDPDAGYSAAKALEYLSLRDPRITPALLEILRKNQGIASYWALVALEELTPSDPDAVPLLIGALAHGSSDMRTAAAKAIALIGPGAKAAVPALIHALSDGDSWTVKCAIIALGRIGSEAAAAIPALTAQLGTGRPYRIDAARALWKIDPAQNERVVPGLIAHLVEQRQGPQAMLNDFFSAIELLAEIGPPARAAIPILQANLQGSAQMHAVWALWRIDDSFSAAATQMLGACLDCSAKENRLVRLSEGSRFAGFALQPREEIFELPFSPRLAAVGSLWQMHPEKRAALQPCLVLLLHEWETSKVLKELTAETASAAPAIQESLAASPDSPMHFLAKEVLRKIHAADSGRW